jgi:hypothetical protein
VSLGTDTGARDVPADGADAPAAPETRRARRLRWPGAPRGDDRLALLCLVLAILPIVVATGRAIAQDWIPVGDNAYFTIRSRDVLTDHHPLLGSWTSASLTIGTNINNPGPLLFDALAVPAKIDGRAGLAIGVALINVASVVGIAVAARRQAGARGVVAAMAAAAGLGWAMGSELLFDPWQPHSLLLPFLCFLVLVWSLACGDLAVLPWAVGLASFVVQTHIGYAFLVPTLGAWGVGAAGARLWRARRDDGDGWPPRRRQARRQVVAAAVVGLVCWSQPLYEQFFGDGRGNLGRLASSVTATQAKVGLARAPRFFADVVALPPWWGRPSSSEAFAEGSSLPPLALSVAGVALVAALLVAGVLVSRRRGDTPGATAATTGLVALGIALVASTTMPIGVLGVGAHHVRWLWPLAVFVTFAVALPLVAPPGRGRAPRAGLALLVLAATALSVLNLPAMSAGVGPSADADSIPALRALLPQLASLRAERVLVDVRGLRFAEPFSVPVMAELQRLGVPWFVDDEGMARQLGDTRAYAGGATVRLFLREGDAAREIPPGTRRVAFAEGLTSDEATELEELKADLTPFIAGGGLALDGRGDSAGSDQPHEAGVTEEQLRDPEFLLSLGTASSRYSRALVYLVVFGWLDVPERWSAPLERYAELQQRADRLTVAVFTEPLEATA